MKRTLFFFLIVLLSFSLTYGQTINKDSLIKQLLTFESAVLKGDKQKVADYFIFPIADQDLKMKVELYGGETEVTISNFDRKTFLKYYQRIILNEFVELFRQMDLAQLKSKNQLKSVVVPKSNTDKCYRNYEVSLEGEEVQLIFFSDTRDDIELSDEDFCAEYAEFWTFRLVKGQLKFKGIGIAG